MRGLGALGGVRCIGRKSILSNAFGHRSAKSGWHQSQKVGGTNGTVELI